MPSQNAWGLTRPLATDAVGLLPSTILALINELAPGPAKTAAAFAAGWGNFGSPHETVGYYRHLGRTYLQGLGARTGATASATTVFTLPAGYRPSGELVFGTISSGGQADVRVNAAGNVIVQSSATTGWFVSFSGISFRVA